MSELGIGFTGKLNKSLDAETLTQSDSDLVYIEDCQIGFF